MKKNVALTNDFEKNVCFALWREKFVRLGNTEKKIVRRKGKKPSPSPWLSNDRPLTSCMISAFYLQTHVSLWQTSYITIVLYNKPLISFMAGFDFDVLTINPKHATLNFGVHLQVQGRKQ